MGADRVHCTLFLSHPLSPETTAVIREHLGQPDSNTEDGLWLTYDEVKYGELPDEVETALVAEGHRFMWTWCSGPEWSNGCQIFDGTETHRWALDEGNIMISAHEAGDHDNVARALAAQKIYDEL